MFSEELYVIVLYIYHTKESFTMDEYKKSHLILWNGITYALEMMEKQNYGIAKELLIKAQQDAEEAFINSENL